ncbi:MAG: glycosyltransferase, partial [Sedimentisphaerales bacterium]
SHHPFLIGSSAVRVAAKHRAPLVYTQHTMFEQYTHYVPVDLPRMASFVVNLCTGYANMAEQVIAPSESVAGILRQRGVITPVETIATGIFLSQFERGDGDGVRTSANIPRKAFVVGHVGRLAPEKNLECLSQSVARFLQDEPGAHFLVAGYGPSEDKMREFFSQHGLRDRVHFVGKRRDQALVDTYHAMDVFAFSSKSETQGLVLMEAMAAGVPAVAVDAPGVRDVVRDRANGYLLQDERVDNFARALKELCHLSSQAKEDLVAEARRTAAHYSMDLCASRIESVYHKLLHGHRAGAPRDKSVWEKSIEEIGAEWEVLANLTSAVEHALYKGEK